DSAHRLAELLVVAWRLGTGEERIPTSHGILDRALRGLHDANALPQWTKDELHFTDSRVGLQCVELPDILEWAQRSQLTTAPNPSYESTQVAISDWFAESLLDDLELSREEAVDLGKQLSDEVVKVKTELSKFECSQIEEY
ncbi:MAG: hypothetical protein MI861_23680, partial [Pirellulales bacterium]|nr:hypothetical protein [Pirellulales bacterium]